MLEDPKSHECDYVNATPIFWRLRQIKRRVDTIMDCETLSVAYASNVSRYLTGIACEMGVIKNKSVRPLILNDNNSCVTHIKSNNKPHNLRLSVLFNTLSRSYTKGEFSLRWICGKTRNVADVLTKDKSPLWQLFMKALRDGKLFVPRR